MVPIKLLYCMCIEVPWYIVLGVPSTCTSAGRSAPLARALSLSELSSVDSSVVSRLSPLVASSDASALVGSEPNHYTQLYTFLSGLCRPATPEVLCIKTHPSTTVRGSTHGFEVVRAISKAHTNATAHAWRSILAPAVRVLNIEASGLRAFVWSAVELRLFL